jgi:hypothetical protein
MTRKVESRKCPRCGHGDLVDVTYRERPPQDTDEPIQAPETQQVETYSCGHELTGPRLDRTAAGTEKLESERRRSDETVEPL